MYDRTPRYESLKEITPGPGQYNLQIQTRFPADYSAPFLVSSNRFEKKTNNDNVSPNSYTIKNEIGNKPGGYFWLSTSKRFEDPSHIKPRKLEEYNFRLGNGVCNKPFHSLRATRKSLAATKKERKFTPPSIPDRKYSNGYEFNPDGTLYKVDPIENDTTIGPAFYNVPTNESCLSTMLYKGNFWSHRSSARQRFTEITPGPGDYNIPNILKKDLMHFPRDPLYMSRYLDELVYNELKQNTPGPAGYFIPDSFRMNLMDLCCDKAPFGTSAERFPKEKLAVGPYLSQSSNATCSHFQNSSLAPFGSTAPRFKRFSTNWGPEPNRYHIKSFIDEARAKHFHSNVIAQAKVAPFGSSTPRMKLPVDPFTIFDKPVQKRLVLDLSTKSVPLKSTRRPTRRLVPSKVVHPAPGDHEVTRVLLYLRQKTSHRKPSSRKPDPAAFLVSSRRFSEYDGNKKLRFEKCKRPRKYEIPGPGAYNLADVDPYPDQGISFTKQKRFIKPVQTRWPSPASYKPSPAYYHTVLKRTYNTTLHSELPRNYGAKWRPTHFKTKYSAQSITSKLL